MRQHVFTKQIALKQKKCHVFPRTPEAYIQSTKKPNQVPGPWNSFSLKTEIAEKPWNLRTCCLRLSVENVQIINITHSNIKLKTRLYLLKMNIFYTQQQENILCSSHLENDSQIILSWSGILAPLKSIAALSELHYHLSFMSASSLTIETKFQRKNAIQSIFIHSDIQACTK